MCRGGTWLGHTQEPSRAEPSSQGPQLLPWGTEGQGSTSCPLPRMELPLGTEPSSSREVSIIRTPLWKDRALWGSGGLPGCWARQIRQQLAGKGHGQEVSVVP